MRLHLQAHLADLVQEDGALMRQLQRADPVAIGAGEAALGVTEELGLEQRLGHGAAIDGDEAPCARAECAVDELRDQILADAALAGDEDLGVARCGARRQRMHLSHASARPHDQRAVEREFIKRQRSTRCLSQQIPRDPGIRSCPE